MEPEKLLTVEEAADLLQVKTGTLYSWVSKGKIPFRKVGALLRFHPCELMDWTLEQAGCVMQQKPRRTKLSVVK